MSVSGTSDVGLNGKSIGFYIKLHLVKGILGGNAEDSGEIRFGEEGITVVYLEYTNDGVRGKILSYIDNRSGRQ